MRCVSEMTMAECVEELARLKAWLAEPDTGYDMGSLWRQAGERIRDEHVARHTAVLQRMSELGALVASHEGGL